jgi:RHS repeat-associated protein
VAAVDVDAGAAYLYCYDANGNVGQVVGAGDGSLAARYEYDGFGQTVLAEGDFAGQNPYRFSTKYFDDEVKLYYYGYRYYSAGLGRWISRDPLEEELGGINLYTFSQNSGVNNIDFLGMEPVGHHIVPQSIWKGYVIPEVKKVFDDVSARLSHPDYNWHGSKTLNGISHPKYTAAVGDKLADFMKEKGICCLDKLKPDDAREFLRLVDQLPDDHLITKFNLGVLEEIEEAKFFGKRTWKRLATGKNGKAILAKSRIPEVAADAAKILKSIPGLKYTVIVAGTVIAYKDAEAAGWSKPVAGAYIVVDTISPVGAVITPSMANVIVEKYEKAMNKVDYYGNRPSTWYRIFQVPCLRY